jgi:hypothetical protein
MEKEFVSYEQAVALKELEFTEPCFAYYGINNIEDKLFFDIDPDDYTLTSLNQNQFYHKNLSEVGRISAPLKQQTFKWIREKYKYYFWIEPCSQHKFFHFTISCSPSSFEYWTIDESKPNSGALSSYPEAENEMLNKLVELAKKYGIFREL